MSWDEVGEAGKWGDEGRKWDIRLPRCLTILQIVTQCNPVTPGQMCSIVTSRGNCSQPIKCNIYWNVEWELRAGTHLGLGAVWPGQVIIQCRDLMQGSVRAESRIIALLFLHNLDRPRLIAYIRKEGGISLKHPLHRSQISMFVPSITMLCVSDGW